ncbi:hypothetical protein KAZ57_02295, partial [Patescibacteria group bacterium]|nr:hypothetical protein [Patescibacteria group bacterium]
AEACLQEQYASIFPAENTDNYPENQVCLDEEHVDDQLEDPVLPTIGVDHCPANKKKKTFTSPDPDYPACALSFAGPNICAGSLSKDTTLNIAPKKDETTLNTDFISRASNSMVFAFWPPSKDMPLYRAVMQLDSRATSSAEAPNLHDGKETKGVGGPNASFLEIAKHPLYFNTLVNYLPIKYWCSDTTGILPAGSGAWDCTIQDVPEEITLEDLLDMAEGGCSLSGSCAPPTIPQGMSFEMQAVINAAAAAYNVPAGMIVAAMNGVNGFLSPYTGIWQLADEEDVGIPWWGRIPVDGCDDFASGEQGPYDILIGYFYPQAVEIVSKGRSVTASRCNFLDATFSVAYGLASASSPGSCSDWSEQLKVDALCTFAVGADPLGAHQEFCATTVANDWMAVANACSE